MKMNDLTGQKFGKLQVIERTKSHNNKVKWRCICECGKSTVAESYLLKKGYTKSCGCLKSEVLKERNMVSNPITRIPGYKNWISMISRCTYQNDVSYLYYGGRGIKVCDRWLNSFANFIEDMGERPSPNHSIDRINSDGNYSSDNCKWSTQLEQIRNRRTAKNNTSGVNGVSFHKETSKWVSTIYVNGKRMYLGGFENVQDAIDIRKESEEKYWGKESS
jgi:hypothetical protein